MTSPFKPRLLLAAMTCSALAGCNLAPHYRPPSAVPGGAALPATFKADPGWDVAQPSDDVAKGAWWKLFNDPVLDALEAKVVVNNQNVAAQRAAWMQARATAAQDKAALFPTVGVSASATHTGRFGGGQTTQITGGQITTSNNNYTASASASWEPDLWGKLTNTLHEARAQAQATAADYANVTLSAQASLANDYMALRAIDAEIAVLDPAVLAETQALRVTQNQYAAGTVSRATVDSAEQTLAGERATRRDLDRARAANEDAIAMLIGENPSTFRLEADPAWQPVVPEVPGVLPSRLLERRPDIAAAERSVAAANAAIGVARAAFFPTVPLTGSVETTTGTLSSLFGAATSLWSLGASASETLLDFGARSAQLRGAKAAYDQAVANYRQTALAAFQAVEDNLAARAAYADEAREIAREAHAADDAARIARAELDAGTIDAATVSSAIATAATTRQSQIESTLNRQSAAIALIEAIGGTWSDAAPAPTAGPPTTP